LDSGLPVIATGIGAFTERIASSRNARVVPWNASAKDFNDALVAAAAPATRSSALRRPRMSFDEYRRLYLAGWNLNREAASGEAPMIEARWLAQPPPEPDLRPLAYLFEDGVVCGKARSLEGLRKLAFDPDSLFASAEARVRELSESLALAEQELKRIEGSRSWRITAPLRGLVRRLRRP
jgi:hypothetical protein